MTAKQVASILHQIETLLTLHGEDEFKARAYSRAARSLETSAVDIEEVARQGRIQSIPGIGAGLAPEVKEIVESGTSGQLDALLKATPPGLLDILKIRGLGAKKVRAIHSTLGISTLGELEYACQENRIAALAGFGAKSQEKILAGLAEVKRNLGKFRIDAAMIEAEHLLPLIGALASVERVDVCGHLRRGDEEYDALQFVVAARSAEDVARDVVESNVLSDVSIEEGRIVGMADETFPVKIYVADPADYFVALHQHTGAHDYCFMVSIPLHERGYELREESLYRDGQRVELRSEEEIFELARMQYIIPEIREGWEETPRALAGTLPEFVAANDIQGVMHVHSNWSDGQNTLTQLAEHARSLGYRWLLICDHSKAASYANGLDERRLEAQGKEIDEINSKYDPAEFRLLKGLECDILAQGEMDLTDDALASLDAMVASIHSNFQLPSDAQTDRLCRALDNRYVTMLGHPTGRLLLTRRGYEPDLRQVINHAADRGKAIELNANPHRLDLNWRMIRYAIRKGVRIAINPDAHSLAGFDVMRYGLTIARKGWVTKENVLNALSAEEFLEFVRATRS